MKALLQRVSQASVSVDAQKIAEIGPGLLILLGVGQGDTPDTVKRITLKISKLRIFTDGAGKMNLSILDTKGQALVVSQFTLLADVSSGNRPSFTAAALPALANELYELFVAELTKLGICCQTGQFAANMQVALVNDGPVTVMVD